ncbi:uncharacterized protein E5676_scaffold266G002560 [Cucumis melo var. makuwa]|uniref:Uncharacterized protein n=1 Tax=Cucumis melo var. makuwa TaxID=1194695 RepID=A0A5A7TA40_CUCMM|nr:uncharacterized protein E6C27_scaffold122G00670 [Cucumis melo var. makuwa]TYK24699.1 uncharacterized protein E5676_scaffold266G002560 [Cucumis melo var. makuwa]
MNYPTLSNTRLIFFKCTRWQLEETLDKFSCPFHYYCDTIYPGDYPAAIDLLVLIFTATTYISTLLFMLLDMSSNRGKFCFDQPKKFLLPSGPFSLPVFLFVLAKGHRINTLFPLFLMGPPILQLIYISALTFDNGADKDIKYVFFEASTMSGILHASLNLDFVILPYYTGLDALIGSNFSGECTSCVCRNAPLVVGGNEVVRKVVALKWLLEGLGWVLITWDCVYLSANLGAERRELQGVVYGCVFGLVFVHVIKLLRRWQLMYCIRNYNQLDKV